MRLDVEFGNDCDDVSKDKYVRATAEGEAMDVDRLRLGAWDINERAGEEEQTRAKRKMTGLSSDPQRTAASSAYLLRTRRSPVGTLSQGNE